MFLELNCPECHVTYKYAAELLKHFAEHVELSEKTKLAKKMRKLPDLQPINKAFCKTNVPSRIEEMLSEKTVDDVDVLNFCEVTMEESSKTNEATKVVKTIERKYRCSFCSRCFGWPTDLKRHILTHTGEKPFVCKYCNSKFTRNFVLQKHMLRQHDVIDCECTSSSKYNVPPLKPIHTVLQQKSRKKEEHKTKKKNDLNNFELVQTSLVCSN